MLGEKVLFISLCGMYKMGRLDGSPNPYLRVTRESEEGEDEF
jgi:hypothetical protein